jgi:hypothetical protein
MTAYRLVDPSSRLSWSMNWEAWLGDGDSIASHQWSITPLNGTDPESPVLTDAETSVVKVEGLMAGRVYSLVDRVVTAAGVQDERSITLRCENR